MYAYGPDGNLTGWTQAEPEWDDYSRQEALAAVIDDRRTCKSCGQIDALVRVRMEDREVHWGDGRIFLVEISRCLSCMALDLVRRDFERKHEKHKDVPGVYSPGDGIRDQVRLIRPPSEG